MKKDISYIRDDVNEIKVYIKSMGELFVLKKEFDVKIQSLNESFEPYRKGLWIVASAVILAIVNSVLEIIRFQR